MTRFAVHDAPLAGVKIVERQAYADERGFLSRIFCSDELASAGCGRVVAQLNHTQTARRGTVRGLHFQRPPFAEAKLVTCIVGAIWDVAVDLREGSPTFGQYYAHELSAHNHTALFIPEGFAHGFQTLSDDVHIIYCHSVAYEPKADGGLNPFDPRICVAWPLDVSVISAKDRGLPMLGADFKGLKL